MGTGDFFQPNACEDRCLEASGQHHTWSALSESTLETLFSHIAHQFLAHAGCRALIYLMGPLGAGKSTAARALIRAMGVTGPIKSPTYALLEPYRISAAADTFMVGHWDLYRLADPDDIEQLGFRDYLAQPGLQLIEWPERGVGYLPWPDLACQIDVPMAMSAVQERDLRVYAFTAQGRGWLAELLQQRD